MRPASFTSYNVDLLFCIAGRKLPHSHRLQMVRLGRTPFMRHQLHMDLSF